MVDELVKHRVPKESNITDVDTLNTEEYINIKELRDAYASMGFKDTRPSNAARCLPSYLSFHKIMCYRLNDVLYVKKEDAEFFIAFIRNFDRNHYYTREEVANEFGVKKDTIRFFDRGHLTPYKYAGVFYYKKEEVDYFKNLRQETMRFIELRKYLGVRKRTLKRVINILKSNGNKNVDLLRPDKHILGNDYLVKGFKDIIEYIQAKNDFKEMDSYYDKFLYKTKDMDIRNCKGASTLKELKVFAKEKYDGLKDGPYLSQLCNSHAKLYGFLNEKLKKPLHEYNKKEFIELCNELKSMESLTKMADSQMGYFAQYIRNKHRKSKLPTIKLELINNNKKKKTSTESSNNDYSTEQWTALARLVVESTNHANKIKLAAKSRAIAGTWLYVALHFVVSWRRGNICDILHPDLTLLGFNTGKEFLEYMKNGGIFTESMGEIICLNVMGKINGIGEVATKNEEPLKFVISESWLRPIGLLLALCEAHRQTPTSKRSNTEQLIAFRNCSKFTNLYRLFGEEYKAIHGEKEFSNLAATRIMSKLYEKKGLEVSVALSQLLPAAARSHKPNFRSGAARTMSDYYLTYAYNNKDNDVNNITIAMVDRGFMSSAAYKLLFTLNPGFKYFKLDEQTDMIKKLALTPTQVHSMSMTVMKKQSEIDNLMKELISSPKSRIKEVLINMLDGKAPSKHHCANCLLRAALYKKTNTAFDSGITDVCVMKQSTTCFGCDFLIGEKYFLLEVAAKIKEIIGYFNNSTYYRDKKRYVQFLKTLSIIVAESASILGFEKVSNYITKEIASDLTLALKENATLKGIVGE